MAGRQRFPGYEALFGGEALVRKIGRREPFWQAQLAVLAALTLYLTLPDRLTFGPRYLIPALELAVLAGLVVSTPRAADSPLRRWVSLGLIALVSIANAVSIVLLVHYLLRGGIHANGRELIFSSIAVWGTNVLIFGLWYWELDRGGPVRRGSDSERPPDFLFPQMGDRSIAPNWMPVFIDYMYVAFTNATAFSPTDAMPVSRMAKLLMTLQALVSLLTVVIVGARAVNILQ